MVKASFWHHRIESKTQETILLKNTSIKADVELTPWSHFSGGFLCSKRMGKTKPFKVDKRDFAKEIQNLMNKQAMKEKYKSEELEKAQRSRVVEDEGSFIEVSKTGNTS